MPVVNDIFVLKNNGKIKCFGGVKNTLAAQCQNIPSDVIQIVFYENNSEFICLRSNGTIYASNNVPAEIKAWTNVKKLYAFSSMYYALRNDGTVIGYNLPAGLSNVSTWTGITKLAHSIDYVLGLKSNNTVVGATRIGREDLFTNDPIASSYNRPVSSWTNVVDIFACYESPQCLRSDGTTYSCGRTGYNQDLVNTWTGISKMDTNPNYDWTVAVKTNGTVVTTNVALNGVISSWTNIKNAYTFPMGNIVAITNSGTLLFAMNSGQSAACIAGTASWTNISEILVASTSLIVARKIDGSIVIWVASESSTLYDSYKVGALSTNTKLILINTTVVYYQKNDNSWDYISGKDANMNSTIINGYRMNECENWENVTALNASNNVVIGLRNDGKAYYSNIVGLSSMTDLECIQSISLGLKRDGTCYGTTWTDIKKISDYFGLKKDGTCLYANSSDTNYFSRAVWPYKTISMGLNYTVVVDANNTVWGYGSFTTGSVVNGMTNIIDAATSRDSNDSIVVKTDGTVLIYGSNYSAAAIWTGISKVFCGNSGSVFGIKSDGTVVSAGGKTGTATGKINTTGWNNMKQISCTSNHAVGVKNDGTCVASGTNDYGQCTLTGFTGISKVACGEQHSVGLKTNGTVVAVGRNDYGQCSVSTWTGIVDIAVTGSLTVGVKADGTVVYTGKYSNIVPSDITGATKIWAVSGWSSHALLGITSSGSLLRAGSPINHTFLYSWINIKNITSANSILYAVKNDGTTISSGGIDVSSWTNIVHMSASAAHAVGLKADGSCIAAGSNSNGECNVATWTNIKTVYAGTGFTIGLKKDGTIITTGANTNGRFDVNAETGVVAFAEDAFENKFKLPYYSYIIPCEV